MILPLVSLITCNSHLVSSRLPSTSTLSVTRSTLSRHEPDHAAHLSPPTFSIDGSMAGELMYAVSGAVDQVKDHAEQVKDNVMARFATLSHQAQNKFETATKYHLRQSPASLHASPGTVYVSAERRPCSVLGGLFSMNLSASCCFSVNVLTQRSLKAYGLAQPCLKAWSCEQNGITPTVKFERKAARQLCRDPGCLDAVTQAMHRSWLTWRSAGKIASVCKVGDPAIEYAPKVASAVATYLSRAKHLVRGARASHKVNSTQKHSGMHLVQHSGDEEEEEETEDASSTDDAGDAGSDSEEEEWTLEKCQEAHCDPKMVEEGNSERDMFCQHAASEEGETENGHPCYEHCCTSAGACFPGDAIVHTRAHGDVTLAALRRGDDVLVETYPGGPLQYEPVLDFLHRRPEKGGAYVELVHVRGRLRASPNHLVFVASQAGRMDKPAGEVSVGDRLFVVDGTTASQSRVVEVRHLNDAVGMYAPLTYSGTIVVDGVVASTYATPKGGVRLTHHLAHSVLLPLRMYISVGLQKLTSTLSKAFCNSVAQLASMDCNEKETEYHPYVALLYFNLQVHWMLPRS